MPEEDITRRRRRRVAAEETAVDRISRRRMEAKDRPIEAEEDADEVDDQVKLEEDGDGNAQMNASNVLAEDTVWMRGDSLTRGWSGILTGNQLHTSGDAAQQCNPSPDCVAEAADVHNLDEFSGRSAR